MSRSVWYCIPEQCTESRYELRLSNPFSPPMQHLSLVSDECAEDYWYKHDGYEARWPLEFQIFETENSNKPLATFEVDMAPVPIFTSSKKEPKADAEG